MEEPWTVVASGTTEELRRVSVDLAGRVWVGSVMSALLRSDDGARTFQRVARLSRGGIEGIWSSGDGRVVICNGGRVLASDDDGATFCPTTARGQNYGLLRWQAGAIYLTGRFGNLTRSVDGGRTWKTLKTGSRCYIYSVGANSLGTICAGGPGVAILSTDDGATWCEHNLRHKDYVRCVLSFADGDIVLVADQGRIARKRKGGAFRKVRSGTRQDLHAVLGVSDVEMFAVGYGVALRSVDRGVTWTREVLPSYRRGPGTYTDPWMNEVAALPAGRLVAVGTWGLILVRDAVLAPRSG
jgi:hypothetical protein